MLTPLYMENSYPIDYSFPNCEQNEKDIFATEDKSNIRTENQSLSSAEIKSISDKISDKLVKLVESQLGQQL